MVQIKELLFWCTTNLTTTFLERVTQNYFRLRKWPKTWANLDAMSSINQYNEGSEKKYYFFPKV